MIPNNKAGYVLGAEWSHEGSMWMVDLYLHLLYAWKVTTIGGPIFHWTMIYERKGSLTEYDFPRF